MGPYAERVSDNCITWSIHENPLEQEIPSSYGLAVLLQRRNNSAKFKVVFKIKANCNRLPIYIVGNLSKPFYG